MSSFLSFPSLLCFYHFPLYVLCLALMKLIHYLISRDIFGLQRSIKKVYKHKPLYFEIQIWCQWLRLMIVLPVYFVLIGHILSNKIFKRSTNIVLFQTKYMLNFKVLMIELPKKKKKKLSTVTFNSFKSFLKNLNIPCWF